jgi:hypothetical protein
MRRVGMVWVSLSIGAPSYCGVDCGEESFLHLSVPVQEGMWGSGGPHGMEST